MLRAAFIALTVLLLTACAHAQEGRVDRSEEPIVQVTANIIAQALPESRYRAWGYSWDAMSSRVSPLVHWHIVRPDARDRPADAVVRRNGWVEAPGLQIGISVFGTNAAVTMLLFEYNEFTNLDLLDALRDAGAAVSFQADYETYSEYIVTPPGREAGLLTLRWVCSPPQSAVAQRCHSEAELSFAPDS